MQPPRWFWAVLALCAVVLTVALVVRLRYLPLVSHPGVVDVWRSRTQQPMVPPEIVRAWTR